MGAGRRALEGVGLTRPPAPKVPEVSVLMPTYNNGAYIAEAIESVQAQTLTNWELVISDNASTDETQQVAAAYAARDPRIRYVRNEINVGLCGNFNLSYRRAHPESPYLAILPSDDTWQPEFLAVLVGALETHLTLEIAHCDALRVDNAGNVLDTLSAHFQKPPAAGPHGAQGLLTGDFFIHPPAALIRRRALSALPGGTLFDETLPYMADYHMWLQLMLAGAEALYLETPLLNFRMHDASTTTQTAKESAAALRSLRSEITVLERVAALCPPELEAARRKGLSLRRTSLAFRLMSLGESEAQYAEARAALRRDLMNAGASNRLGKLAALIVASLPLSPGGRKRLFQSVSGMSQRTHRTPSPAQAS